jgi:hypothetical protein
MTNFETYQLVIGGAGVLAVLFAAWLAFLVGQNQNSINRRMLKLQDYVAVSVVPNKESIGIWNTGNSNLYMWGFDMPGNKQRFDPPRLISRSTVANYWIPAPNLGKISTTTNFDFRLYLTDEYGDKWISNNGGEASPIKIKQAEKEVDGISFKVWSYKTTKEDWSF